MSSHKDIRIYKLQQNGNRKEAITKKWYPIGFTNSTYTKNQQTLVTKIQAKNNSTSTLENYIDKSSHIVLKIIYIPLPTCIIRM
jgi:hypothetical protein